MSYSIQLPAVWIKEKYLDPLGLPEGLLNEIPVAGYGGGPGVQNRWPMYEKAAVEKVLKNHPDHAPLESLLKKEDFNMVDFDPTAQPFERIASCLEQLVEVLVPREVPKPPPGPQMLTVAEAAKQMRRHVQTVMKWCRQKKLGTKIGRTWLISQDEVRQYLKGRLLIKGRVAG